MPLNKQFVATAALLFALVGSPMLAEAQGSPRVRSTAPSVPLDDSIPDLRHVVQKGQFPEALRDSDADGISDLDDNCPATAADWPRRWLDHCGCPIDPCTVDEDGDGAKDCVDICGGTLKGLAVLENGCPAPITEVVRLTLDIKFDFATAHLQEGYLPEIEKLRALLAEFADLEVTLEGHTDSKGSAAYNQALSDVRARVVRNAVLDDARISPDRIKVIGYGESRPIATNRTEAGRAINRRTIAEITAQRLRTPDNAAPDLAVSTP